MFASHSFVASACRSIIVRALAYQRFGFATMASDAAEIVNRKINEKKVMVFSKSFCPYCAKAKKVLGGYNLPPDVYEVIELDKLGDEEKMGAMQSYLKDITGASSVPRVFIGAKCVGGGDDVAALEKNRELKTLLTNVGALKQ